MNGGGRWWAGGKEHLIKATARAEASRTPPSVPALAPTIPRITDRLAFVLVSLSSPLFLSLFRLVVFLLYVTVEEGAKVGKVKGWLVVTFVTIVSVVPGHLHYGFKVLVVEG